MKNEVFPVKVSINNKYKQIINFYTIKNESSLSRLFNVLLDEVDKDKPFKFKILKKLEKFNEANNTNL